MEQQPLTLTAATTRAQELENNSINIPMNIMSKINHP